MNAGHPSDRAVLREPEAAVRDIELLELAARAAGLPWDQWVIDGDDSWNPRIDDGDALRLAVKLQLEIVPLEGGGVDVMRTTEAEPFGVTLASEIGPDPYDATRLAIVRAAAQIGSELRKTASGCSHTAGPDDQSKVDDQEPTAGSSHG